MKYTYHQGNLVRTFDLGTGTFIQVYSKILVCSGGIYGLEQGDIHSVPRLIHSHLRAPFSGINLAGALK